MHDTPKKAYFDRPERRVQLGLHPREKPLELAELLLDDPQRWTQAQVGDAIGQGKTRTLLLKKPIPVLVLYWTVDVDEKGQVRFKPTFMTGIVSFSMSCGNPQKAMVRSAPPGVAECTPQRRRARPRAKT